MSVYGDQRGACDGISQCVGGCLALSGKERRRFCERDTIDDALDGSECRRHRLRSVRSRRPVMSARREDDNGERACGLEPPRWREA